MLARQYVLNQYSIERQIEIINIKSISRVYQSIQTNLNRYELKPSKLGVFVTADNGLFLACYDRTTAKNKLYQIIEDSTKNLSIKLTDECDAFPLNAPSTPVLLLDTTEHPLLSSFFVKEGISLFNPNLNLPPALLKEDPTQGRSQLTTTTSHKFTTSTIVSEDAKSIPFSKKLVILDFDFNQNLISKELQEAWCTLIAKLIEKGNHVAIASFAGYSSPITSYLTHVLKISHFLLSKIKIHADKSLNYETIRKHNHIAYLKRQYGIENNSDVILVDDNNANCIAAEKEGCLTIFADTDTLSHLKSLYRQLIYGLEQSPARELDTRETKNERFKIPTEFGKPRTQADIRAQIANPLWQEALNKSKSTALRAPTDPLHQKTLGKCLLSKLPITDPVFLIINPDIVYGPFNHSAIEKTEPYYSAICNLEAIKEATSQIYVSERYYIPFELKGEAKSDNLILDPISESAASNLFKLTGKKALIRYKDDANKQIIVEINENSSAIQFTLCQIENGWQITDSKPSDRVASHMKVITQATASSHHMELFGGLLSAYPTIFSTKINYSDLFIPKKESVLQTEMENMLSTSSPLPTLQALKGIQEQLYYMFSTKEESDTHYARIANIILNANPESFVDDVLPQDMILLSKGHSKLLKLWIRCIQRLSHESTIQQLKQQLASLEEKTNSVILEQQGQIKALTAQLRTAVGQNKIFQQQLEGYKKTPSWHKWLALSGTILGIGLCITGFGSIAGLPIVYGSIATLATMGSIGALILGTIAAVIFNKTRKKGGTPTPPPADTSSPRDSSQKSEDSSLTSHNLELKNDTTTQLQRSLSTYPEVTEVQVTTTDNSPPEGGYKFTLTTRTSPNSLALGTPADSPNESFSAFARETQEQLSTPTSPTIEVKV